jgi:tetratricopeptide (TPR) repeat protein
VLLALLLAVARAQEPAPADPDAEARLLYENGERLYDEGRYEEAITAFRAAYDLSHRPALLYNVANAYERLGRLQDAIDALNGYRIYAPPDQQDVLLARVQALERRLDEERAAAPAPAPTPPPPPPPPTRRSPAPWVLAGVGAAVGLGGTAVAGKTWLDSREILDQRDPAAWDALRPLNNAGFGAALGGGGIAVVGVTWGLLR